MKKTLVWFLVLAMFLIGIVPRVDAAFVPSEALTQFDRASDVSKIQKVLEIKMVQQRLQDLGFTTQEIASRVDQMSDAQLHSLALKLDQLNVGQDGGWTVLAVVLVIALIVVLVIYFSGHRVAVTR